MARLRIFRWSLMVMTAIFLIHSAFGQSPAKRQPMPAADAQAKAEKLVKELFKDDFAKKKPADMLALSAKLLEQATETKDDAAARFVLFREARDLAAQAGDAGQALKVVNDIVAEFAVNGPVLKAEALAVVASVTTAPAESKALVETVLQVVEEAVADDNFEAADKLLKVASAAATKAKSIPLVSTVQARAKDVEAIQKEFEAVKLALEKLAKNPKDADASGIAGRYLCLMKGDWEKGLPMLAMGGDTKLKAPATKELAEPKEAAAQVEVGDAWWDLAEAEKGRAKGNLQKRALHWYRLALPNLAGLTKTKIEKRVAQVGGAGPTDKARTVVFKDIKDLGGLGTSKKAGDWSIKNRKLVGSADSIFWFNDTVADSFSVKMTCTIGATSQAIALGPDVVYGKGEFIIIDLGGGQMNVTLSYSGPLTANVLVKPGRCVIEAKVSKGTLVVDVDGKESLRCKLDKPVPVLRRVGIYTPSGNIDVESVSFGPLATEKK